MNKENVKTLIEAGKAVVGIELGSTRIKAVMIDENHQPVATGSYDWENRLDGHIWTYDLEDIWKGLKASYANMAADVKEKYGTEIKSLAGIGFSDDTLFAALIHSKHFAFQFYVNIWTFF